MSKTTTTMKTESSISTASLAKTSDINGASGKPAPPALQRTSMSLYELLDLPIALLSIPVVGFLALLSGPFRARKQRLNPNQTITKTLFLHIGYAIFRRIVTRLTPSQIQLLSPGTKLTYRLFTMRKRVPPQNVDLGDGASGHWVGNKNAKNVLIWIHGGGFAIPANRGYFAFFDQFLSEMQKAGKDLAIFAVAYTLIPKASYPTQLRQSVAALRYILQATGRDPANIYLGGDSAGGNLVLGILSHLSHPHPEIKPLHISGKLGGATLMSPWSSLETEFPPQETEPLGDLVTAGAAKPWASGYLNGRDRDYYTDASMAPVEWWDGLQIKEILIVGGGYELLLPFIEDLVEKLKVKFPNVDLFVGPGEAHVAAFFNLFLGDRTETEQGKRVKTFYREILN